ncbi:MAG: hypothetical protein ACREDS_05145 [Limisphaerales bacterium]
MAVRLPKSIYIHLMKTGGWSVRGALARMGLNLGEIGRDHDPLSLLPTKPGRRQFSFVFIRHPLAWYRSYWAFRMQVGWKIYNGGRITGWQTYGSILDYECRSNNFTIWMENVLAHMPEGFLSRIYRIYTDRVDYVGKVESFKEDLSKALRMAGETFSQEIIDSFPKRNVTNTKYTSVAILPKELAEKVLKSESFIVNKWKYDSIPPFILGPITNRGVPVADTQELKGADGTEKEQQAIASLTNDDFLYYRVGYDCRLMSFLQDGQIGKGAAGSETRWNVREEMGSLHLDIFSKTRLTCTLQQVDEGLWCGAWLHFEKMDVKLIKTGANIPWS